MEHIKFERIKFAMALLFIGAGAALVGIDTHSAALAVGIFLTGAGVVLGCGRFR